MTESSGRLRYRIPLSLCFGLWQEVDAREFAKPCSPEAFCMKHAMLLNIPAQVAWLAQRRAGNVAVWSSRLSSCNP